MSSTLHLNSLARQLEQRLEQLAASNGPFPQVLQLAVPATRKGAADGTLECEVLQVDRIGCAFSRLAFQTDDLAEVSIDELQARSRRLADQLTYLLEPIQLIEIDSDSCAVQLRSNPPAKDDQGTSYYEIFACRGGQFELCRYRKQPGGTRQRINVEVTRQVLERLARDFAQA